MTKWLIRVGFGLLILASLVVGYWIANRDGPTQEVVVAVGPIGRFATVMANDVTTERRSAGDVPADALSTSANSVGQVALAPIAKDDVVRKSNLVAANAIADRVAITLTTSASSAPDPGTTTDVVVSPRRSGRCGEVFTALLVLSSESSGTTVRVTVAVDSAERDALATMVGSSDVTLAPVLTPSHSAFRCVAAHERRRRARPAA